MKKVVLGLLLIAAAVGLSACEGTLRFVIDVDEDLPDELRIVNPTYGSNYEAEVDGVLQPVICDNRTTIINYSFRYEGDLVRWTSYLQGRDSNRVPPESRVTFEAARFAENNRAAVEYEIPAGLAPLAIVPQPNELGATQLYVAVEGASYDDDFFFRFNDIPVLASCP